MTKIHTGDSSVGVCKVWHNSGAAESKLRCQPNIYAHCAMITDRKSSISRVTNKLLSLWIESLWYATITQDGTPTTYLEL